MVKDSEQNKMSKNIFISSSGRKFYQKAKDLHTQYGMLKDTDIAKAGPGQELRTNKNVSLFMVEGQMIDFYEKIKRMAQIIPLKDVGTIIANTGINKDSRVLDAGAGSGGLACFLAKIAKKVYTYDIRDDHIALVKKNKEFLGLTNLTVKKGNIYEGVPEKELDVVILDLPEPWEALSTAKSSLKPGGFLVTYSPHIPQIIDFVSAVKEDGSFIHMKTFEIIEREWEINGRKVRPITGRIGHSGFLTFSRLVKKLD